MKLVSILVLTTVVLAGCQSGDHSLATASTSAVAVDTAADRTPKAEPHTSTTTSWDGPFGLRMGLTKEEVVDATGASPIPNHPFTYAGSRAPKPHVAFPGYAYTIGDKAGLCDVLGMGDEFDADAFGYDVRGRFSTIEDALTKKYGQPTRVDKDLAPGSIWNEPREWMMGLYKGERSYLVEWRGSASHPLPDHLSVIRLMTRAPSSGRAALGILYEFDNKKSCDEEVARARDAGL